MMQSFPPAVILPQNYSSEDKAFLHFTNAVKEYAKRCGLVCINGIWKDGEGEKLNVQDLVAKYILFIQ